MPARQASLFLHLMIERRAAGFTLVELLIVMAIVGVLLSAGMVGWRYALVRGHETAAVAALTAINQAQAAHAQVCGNGHFAPTLAALGTPMPTSGHAFSVGS
jgi:prepilin-type N-terminal cleavage/methylation domain-containing protein